MWEGMLDLQEVRDHASLRSDRAVWDICTDTSGAGLVRSLGRGRGRGLWEAAYRWQTRKVLLRYGRPARGTWAGTGGV